MNTEVINYVFEIVRNQIDEEFVIGKTNFMVKRLLLEECEIQNVISHMDRNVWKGSLIQAFLHDDLQDKYMYLLAKVEHIDFVNDSDLSFKPGFSKDMKKLW